MNKKIIAFILIILVILFGIFLMFMARKDTSVLDITGEYKLSKVNVDNQDVDYGNLNFYYIFNEDLTGKVIFEGVKSDFTYALEEKDNKTYLALKQKGSDTITYLISKENDGINISHDTLGTMYLTKAEVPSDLKK